MKRGRRPKEKVYAVRNENVMFNPEPDIITDNLVELKNIKPKVVETQINTPATPKSFAVEASNKNQYTLNAMGSHEKQLPEFRNIILPGLYSNLNSKDWPVNTNIHCWWCCYEFEGMPIPVPLKYDVKSERFVLKGCFCSFNCAQAYSFRRKLNNEGLVRLLFKKMNQTPDFDYKNFSIKKAPDPFLLRLFGGILSIEEFRENFTNSTVYNLLPHKMISATESIEARNNGDYIKINTSDRALVSERPKSKAVPKQQSSSIEQVMSISYD
jgi:hypothetical protein